MDGHPPTTVTPPTTHTSRDLDKDPVVAVRPPTCQRPLTGLGRPGDAPGEDPTSGGPWLVPGVPVTSVRGCEDCRPGYPIPQCRTADSRGRQTLCTFRGWGAETSDRGSQTPTSTPNNSTTRNSLRTGERPRQRSSKDRVDQVTRNTPTLVETPHPMPRVTISLLLGGGTPRMCLTTPKPDHHTHQTWARHMSEWVD